MFIIGSVFVFFIIYDVLLFMHIEYVTLTEVDNLYDKRRHIDFYISPFIMEFQFATPVQAATRPVAFDPMSESALRSISRHLSKCPDQMAPVSIPSSVQTDYRDDHLLSNNYMPAGPIGTCRESRSQQIDLPRMASECQLCPAVVIDPWAVHIGGAQTRLNAKDTWSRRCGPYFQEHR